MHMYYTNQLRVPFIAKYNIVFSICFLYSVVVVVSFLS